MQETRLNWHGFQQRVGDAMLLKHIRDVTSAVAAMRPTTPATTSVHSAA
jgi:hypothetical protein